LTKEDVPPLPERPPRKRTQMEKALDIHLAMWAHSESLTPSDKRRVEEERARRKRTQKRTERIGLVYSAAGITPQQQTELTDALNGRREHLTAIWHPWVRSAVHSLCKSFGVPVESIKERDMVIAWKTVIRNTTLVFVLPRGEESEEWEMVRYAKHRNTPVEVIMPNGERR
jgi:hypothetical protein